MRTGIGCITAPSGLPGEISSRVVILTPRHSACNAATPWEFGLAGDNRGVRRRFVESSHQSDGNSVMNMTRSISVSQLGTEFNAFLFAPVGEDRNGMPLSVLSALARQNVDPWQEAAELARLPEELSVRRLTALIGVLPEGPTPRQNPKTTAARLIALLPRVTGFEFPPRADFLGSAIVTRRPSTILVVMFLLAVVLGTQVFAARSNEPPKIASARTLPVSSDASKTSLQSHDPQR